MDAALQFKGTLEWIPKPDHDFLVHIVLEELSKFVYWAAAGKYDENCLEIASLRYLVHGYEAACECIGWTLLAIINVRAGSGALCPEKVSYVSTDLVVTDVHQEVPPNATFPREPVISEDYRLKIREKWEHILSRAQYWWEAYLWTQCPGRYFGGDHRLESPLVLFMMSHLNQILPAIIWLDVVMANTGWLPYRQWLQEHKRDELAAANHRDAQQAALESNIRDIKKNQARQNAIQNHEKLIPLIRDGFKHYRRNQKRAEEEQEARKCRDRRMALKREVEERCREKEKRKCNSGRLPPKEKMLTTSLTPPPHPVPPVPLQRGHSGSESSRQSADESSPTHPSTPGPDKPSDTIQPDCWPRSLSYRFIHCRRVQFGQGDRCTL